MVALSASVEGNAAPRSSVKKQELADNTLTIPASVLASAACTYNTWLKEYLYIPSSFHINPPPSNKLFNYNN